MRSTPWLALSLLSATLSGQVQNSLSSAERAAGWRLLFDGQTFAGWSDPGQKSPPGDSWVIEEGCLKALPGKRIVEDLKTAAEFRDFELKFDWRLEAGGNSGVKYRIWHTAFLAFTDATRTDVTPVERDQLAADQSGLHYEVAMEFQLIDDEKHPDAKKGPDRTTGALYAFAPPTQHAAKAAGEWNESRLVVRGDDVEHWVNGVRVLHANLGSPAVVDAVTKRWSRIPAVMEAFRHSTGKPSAIALQNHDDSVVWFRNLKIRTPEPR